MDSRLDVGLDLNVETDLRRITMVSSLDMYSSLPQIAASEFKTTSPEVAIWPDYVSDMWSGPEYNCGVNTYTMFKNVFDCILSDLHLEVVSCYDKPFCIKCPQITYVFTLGNVGSSRASFTNVANLEWRTCGQTIQCRYFQQ